MTFRRWAAGTAAVVTVVAASPAALASGGPAFTAFPVPAEVTGPDGITTALDGNLWFTDVGGNIVRMTRSGQTAVFRLPSADSFPFPTDITNGPDGSLWFTEANGGNIGRVTLSGAITEFPIPNPDWFSGIAPGWDGNLWFGSRTNGLVGRITRAGVYTGFVIPPADGTHDPIAATIGPRRSVWVSDEASSVIWQVTTAGAIIAHPLPQPNRGPSAITVGWDGNLWFTQLGQTGPAIGRMTPSGSYSEFPVTGTPVAITPGLDGNMWFTEIDSGKVGSVSMSGRVTEYAVPASNPILHGITTGPDGNIWFTDANNLVVWRLAIPHRFSRLPGGQADG